MRRTLALTAALALAVPAAAGALTTADLNADLAIAHDHFPAACSPVTVHDDGSSPPGNPVDWTTLFGYAWIGPQIPACEIWLRPDWQTWDAWILCSTVVHEVGHLSGLQHSTDPTNIMWPSPVAVYGLCWDPSWPDPVADPRTLIPFLPGRPSMHRNRHRPRPSTHATHHAARAA